MRKGGRGEGGREGREEKREGGRGEGGRGEGGKREERRGGEGEGGRKRREAAEIQMNQYECPNPASQNT